MSVVSVRSVAIHNNAARTNTARNDAARTNAARTTARTDATRTTATRNTRAPAVITAARDQGSDGDAASDAQTYANPTATPRLVSFAWSIIEVHAIYCDAIESLAANKR